MPLLIKDRSPIATAASPVRNTVAPNWAWVSKTVATVHQLSPTSVTTPTRAPYSSTTQLFTATPLLVPRFRVRVEAQLEFSYWVTLALSKVKSLRCWRRFRRLRRRSFSWLSVWA